MLKILAAWTLASFIAGPFMGRWLKGLTLPVDGKP
jgi:hypothetical protein